MHCKHLLRYSRSTQIWSVASCCAKNTPYVPSLNELEKFCRSTKHIVCSAYLHSFSEMCPEPDGRLCVEGNAAQMNCRQSA